MAFSGPPPSSVTGSTTSLPTSGQQHLLLQQHNIAKLGTSSGSFDLQIAGAPSPSAMAQNSVDDIIKTGILRKGKKGKKRFFVLHQETYGKPARLDCYESDKQYLRQQHRPPSGGGGQPKLSVPIKTCFNINKMVDNKLKHCIAVYTMDDCLLLGCDSEQEQEAWLQTLLTVLRNTKGGFGLDESGRLNYDYVWDVNILRDHGITEKTPAISGPYRLCMNNMAIFLYRKGAGDHSLEYPLVFIASYGCKGPCWILRVGRTSMTGPGELAMETDDPVIASNINETMKNVLSENHDQRQRSTSIDDRRQSSAWGSRPVSAGQSKLSASSAASSTSLERSGSIGANPQSRTRAISESEKTLQNIMKKSLVSVSAANTPSSRKISAPPSTMTMARERVGMFSSFESSSSASSSIFGTSASPSRTKRKFSASSLRSHLSHMQHRGGHALVPEAGSTGGTAGSFSATVSTAVSPVGNSASTTAASGGGIFGRAATHSPTAAHPSSQWTPAGQSPLATSPAFCSTDGVVASNVADMEHGTMRYLPRQANERAPSMEFVSSPPPIAEENSGSGGEYLPMQTGGGDNKSGASSRASSTSTVLVSQRSSNTPQHHYSPAENATIDTYVDMGKCTLTNVDKDTRRRMTADSGYLEMARGNTAPANELPTSSSSDHVAEGYTPMGPGSLGRSSSSAHSRQTSWHLEEVRSYISDSDSSCSVPPSRAWSLGSRPATSAAGSTNASCYMAMGPTPTHQQTPPSGPMSKIGSYLTSRFNASNGLADDRKRAHSVGSWNKPPWKKAMLSSNAAAMDVANPTSCVDPNLPSTSAFYRPRSESFGSARSTPGSRRLVDGGGSKLSNQSEDLVEMDFGHSIGRSASGSLGSSESLSRSRASSLGGGGTSGGGGPGTMLASILNATHNGMGGSTGFCGRPTWSPKVEQINEQEFLLTHSPSGKFIQNFQHQQQQQTPGAAGASEFFGGDYVPMEAGVSKNFNDYTLMGTPGPGGDRSQPADYVAMASGTPAQQNDTRVQRSTVSRQHSHPGNAASTSAAGEVASSDLTVSAVGKMAPIRHGSGSSNLSLGNCCVGLDSGVGGSSFSLDQKTDAHHGQQPPAHLQAGGPQQQKASSSSSLQQYHRSQSQSTPVVLSGLTPNQRLSDFTSMEQLKERLARVEFVERAPAVSSASATALFQNRRDSLRRRSNQDDDTYMAMDVKPKQVANLISSSGATAKVRRSSSFANSASGSGAIAQVAKTPTNPSAVLLQQQQQISPQSPKSGRSPLLKMFSSFGKGSLSSEKKQQQQAGKSVMVVQKPLQQQEKSPTPSKKVDSKESTLTDPSSTETVLDYASLDLQHDPNSNSNPPISPQQIQRPGGNAKISALKDESYGKIAPPAVFVNDGVVYAQIDPARSVRQY